MRKLPLLLCLLVPSISLTAARGSVSPSPKQWEIRQEIVQLEHIVENLETELSQMHQQLETQQLALEALHDEHQKERQLVKERSRQQEERWESKLLSLERQEHGQKEECKTEKKYLKEVHQTFTELQERFCLLDKRLQKQESAIRDLLTLLQEEKPEKDESLAADPSSVYEVKSGDTLGELAKRFHTSVKTLQELNALSTDRIHVGKKLKLPKT